MKTIQEYLSGSHDEELRVLVAEAKPRLLMQCTQDYTTGCWLWTGHVNDTGYPSIKFGGKLVKAHRASWMIFRGKIPKGMKVCHKCDVRHCVNPSHLFIGTQSDNMKDCIQKGRAQNQAGTANGNSRLTESQVIEIFKFKGTLSAPEVSQNYGITPQAVHQIWLGQRWKSVTKNL